MSGLEVAGVVLATFPLIISGLEHWSTMSEIKGLWRNTIPECRKLEIEIDFHMIIFEKHLELLLGPVIGHVEASNTAQNPSSKWLSDLGVQKQLEQHIGERKFRLYMQIISEMHSKMVQLQKELGLHLPAVQQRMQQLQPSPQALSKSIQHNIDYNRFRLRFALRATDRAKVFEQLFKENDRLAALLDVNRRIDHTFRGGPSDSAKANNLLAAIKTARSYSRQLFETVNASWRCCCQAQHIAGIKLQHITDRGDTWIDLIFAFSRAIASTSNQRWPCQNLRCGRDPHCARPQRHIASTTPLSKHAGALAAPKKKIRFDDGSLGLPQMKLENMIPAAHGLCLELHDTNLQKCLTISDGNDVATCLHPVAQYETSEVACALNLKELLVMSQMDRRRRYAVALAIASAVAQLTCTPWVQKPVSKEDIIFFLIKDSNTSPAFPGEPFIREGFDHTLRQVQESKPEKAYFHALGIILLELCFGRSIEEERVAQERERFQSQGQDFDEDAFKQRERQLEQLDANIRQIIFAATAKEWLDKVSGETGDDYAKAVAWCLTGTISDDWRSDMVREVILPLEDCQIKDIRFV